MPAIYVSKYNRFVDNILGRINRILGKSYDPVRVKLESQVDAKKAGGSTKGSKKKSNNSKRNKTRKGSKKDTTSKRRPSHTRNTDKRNKMGDIEVSKRSTESESREPAFILISSTSDVRPTPIRSANIVTTKNETALENRASTNKKKTQKIKTKATKPKVAKARATLFGLSSLRRDGDVAVSMMPDHTTVKTSFILGPLTLRVEKEFGRGAKRELKSATATTAEMVGKLNLRIMHGGAATLHSIKVLQPKQVRVDSADNHEKSKAYIWRRSSHIASVVSQKLASAARSMLQPPPQTKLT